MACPLPTKPSDAKSYDFLIMKHHPYFPDPAYLHDFGQELGEKGKKLSLEIVHSLGIFAQPPQRTKGEQIPSPPHDNAYSCVPWRKATGGNAHDIVA